jgi:hypothetical protein
LARNEDNVIGPGSGQSLHGERMPQLARRMPGPRPAHHVEDLSLVIRQYNGNVRGSKSTGEIRH